MIRTMIVEDLTMLRDSLRVAIDAQADMTVVSVIADATCAIDEAKRAKPDVILMDICTENGSSGIVATSRLKEACPETRIVIMTGMPDITFLDQARRAGAESFVYKNVSTSELLSVIRSTMEGYSTFPRQATGGFSNVSLTDLEIEILRMACEARTRKEIAARLYLSEGTVKRHIGELLAKTGYDNLMKLAVDAVAKGYIVPRLR